MAGTLLDELKRRKVIRVGLAYLVAAWVAVQVASLGFQAFDAPGWVLRVFILCVLLGFPVALVLTWALDLTPEGIRVDTRGAGTKRVVVAAALLVALAMGWYVYGLPAFRGGDVPREAVAAAAPAATVTTPAVEPRSIAVLPFENLSQDPANAFFADGIQDEILTGLAKVGGLRVISRTSTAKYASRPGNLREIARELGVAHILEGSVQKAGNTVRVNVQLIEAATDAHVWAETYDRELADVFAVQSQVASAIAAQLRATITQGAREELALRPTAVPEAYEAFLRARALRSRDSVFLRDSQERIIAILQEAVRLDPEFGRAWGDLAQAQVWRWFIGWDASPAQLQRSRDALARAERHAPDDANTEMARCVVAYYGDQDFRRALVHAERTREKAPGDARAWFLSALLHRRLGEFDTALADMRHAIGLGPGEVGPLAEYVTTLFAARRWAEVPAAVDATLVLSPDEQGLRVLAWYSLWETGGNAAARAYLDALRPGPTAVLVMQASQARLEGDPRAAIGWWRKALATDEQGPMGGAFASYLPGRVEWQLQVATALLELDGDAARREFTAAEANARAKLASDNNRYTRAAWQLAHAWALAGLGRKAEAVAEADLAGAAVADDRLDGPAFQEYRALVYRLAGERAKFDALVRELDGLPGSIVSARRLREDPMWRRP